MLFPAQREILTSYVGRLAASRGVAVADLVLDLGGSMRQMLNLDPTFLDKLSMWAGVSQGQIDDLCSWSGQRLGDVKMRFRGEVFVSRALRNPVMRGCTACLREDAASRPEAPLEAMVMRGDWQLREVSICLRHSVPLVELWTVDAPASRYDVPARLDEIMASLADDIPTVEPTSYDRWLDRRLEDGQDETALAGRSLHAATTFCRLLGTELLRLDGQVDPDPRLARAAGFDVARRGDDAILAALHRLASHATGKLDEPSKAFGKLYEKFNFDHTDDPAFAPFIDLLRTCILEVWPVAGGQVVLGEEVPQRHLHSVLTAAREAGISTALMRAFLIEAGLVAEDDPRPDSRTTFAAAACRDLLATIPQLVRNGEMRRAIGATAIELGALEEAGLLTPRTRVPTTRARWLTEDGEVFLRDLEALAVPVTPDDVGWEEIQLAKVRRGVPVADLIAEIRRGTLPVGRRTGAEGYHALVVPKTVAAVMARRLASPTDLVPVAEFGRSIGIRGAGGFAAMVEAGHVPSRKEWNPRSRRAQRMMSPDDIATFHRTFMTTHTIAVEYGMHRNSVRTILAAKDVPRFEVEGQSFGAIFHRKDVEPAFG